MKKAAALAAFLENGMEIRLQTLLGKAGARSGALAGLELRVGLADHIDRALAFHDLAIGVAALGGGEGRPGFPDGKWFEVSRMRVPTGARKLATDPAL